VQLFRRGFKEASDIAGGLPDALLVLHQRDPFCPQAIERAVDVRAGQPEHIGDVLTAQRKRAGERIDHAAARLRMRFILEWLDLALRWTHVFAGILWVGTTYYFTWVGRRLGEEGAGVSIVHGGAFYTVRKQAEPPEQLHWFRWEALTTWLTGLALLWIVYYLRGRGAGVSGLGRPAS